jgi:photosystem II stability/assembly factor-like uncharacterized protein
MVKHRTFGLLPLLLLVQAPIAQAAEKWVSAGWGGGGFYYSAAFHPTRDGVIYMGGDVNGAYRSEDYGKTWRIINNGIAGYGVFALAVDPSKPDTVWAATDEGLSKSSDAGETWRTIPKSGPKELRLTGEKNRSFHNVAVDPANGNIVYVGTPHGKIYKTTDGGERWTLIYQRTGEPDPVAAMRMQFGSVNDAIFGGLWMPLKFPATIAAADATGIGFSVKSAGARPRDIFFTLRTNSGAAYQSRNLHDDFAARDWHDIVLTGADFAIDPALKSKSPKKAAQATATPEWSTVNRFDFACVAGFDKEPAVIRMSRLFFTAKKTTDGLTGTATQPVKVTAVDPATVKFAPVYGNLRTGEPVGGPIYGITVSPKEPNVVAEGLLLSTDAGSTWRATGPMRQVVAVAFTAADPNVIYAACMKHHVWKSINKGATWATASAGIAANMEVRDIVVSPANPNEVAAIGSENWGGCFFRSSDGGRSWSVIAKVVPDPLANPTLPAETGNLAPVALSAPRNIAINPRNPQQLFIAANWRSAISSDGGRTWHESDKGADISCVTDIRFFKKYVYVANMDEGVLVSEDNGATWKQLWPLGYSGDLSGHAWRLDVRQIDGNLRILSTSSPWDRQYNQLVASYDGGKTFKPFRQGLPDYLPTDNTMWGRAYARAIAVDPSDPSIVYMGLDGDPAAGKSGGGLFKSVDGGRTWKQLTSQPGSRRVFFGLAVDPTNPKRIYWGASGDKGGIYRSDDGGGTWQRVFSQEQWIFNLQVTADGTVYGLGNQIYRSTNQGKTWKSLAKLPMGCTVVGFEIHPNDPKTIWAATDYWGGPANLGGVFKTTDGGKTWTDITGNLPYRRPLVLRFNPATSELWAGYVGLYRIKQ